MPEWQHKDRPTSLAWAARRLREQSTLVLASHNDVPIGFQAGYVDSNYQRHGYLWVAGVLPAYRKQGIMTSLLRFMGNVARQDWLVGTVELHSGTSYPDMLSLLSKMGFACPPGTPLSPYAMPFRISAHNL
ncbi:GNAT family N-acetyltransferase [Burkholderia contaminans]|nr:GNAT family N-acetyltransferase [Burkholderia contaminans]